MTTIRDEGGPAFPITEEACIRSLYGMTLRDYFAAKVVQGLYASGTLTNDIPDESIAETAYRQADAMLKARAS